MSVCAQSCLTLCDPMDCGLSMGFSRQEYWGGLLFPSLGVFLILELNPGLLQQPADSLPLSHLGSPQQLSTGIKYVLSSELDARRTQN